MSGRKRSTDFLTIFRRLVVSLPLDSSEYSPDDWAGERYGRKALPRGFQVRQAPDGVQRDPSAPTLLESASAIEALPISPTGPPSSARQRPEPKNPAQRRDHGPRQQFSNSSSRQRGEQPRMNPGPSPQFPRRIEAAKGSGNEQIGSSKAEKELARARVPISRRRCEDGDRREGRWEGGRELKKRKREGGDRN